VWGRTFRAAGATSIVTALLLIPAIPATALEPTDAGGSCASEAASVAESAGASSGYDFVCAPGVVTVQIPSEDGSSLTETAEVPLVEAPTAQQRSDYCGLNTPETRTIVNELQVNIDFCVIYGQSGDPQNGSWSRSLKVEWTAYPGYPSTLNRLRTISTFANIGQVTLWGSIHSQRQNGILPPSTLTSAVLELRNGYAVNGWEMYGTNTNGTFAIRVEDFEITDFDYGFNAPVNMPPSYTPRFVCHNDTQRCFYPNGQEAPV